MTTWKILAQSAIVDIQSALTGKPEDAVAALYDAASNLNQAIDNLEDED